MYHRRRTTGRELPRLAQSSIVARPDGSFSVKLGPGDKPRHLSRAQFGLFAQQVIDVVQRQTAQRRRGGAR